jgi:hypothetical protein
MSLGSSYPELIYMPDLHFQLGKHRALELSKIQGSSSTTRIEDA